MDRMKGGSPGREVRLTVGVADVLPKLIAYRILEPALRLPEPVRVEGIEDAPERLLAELAVFGLDVVLADAPVGPAVRVRAYNHLLGECAVSVFGADRLARAYRRGFPRSLDGAPLLLPRQHSALRLALDDWFEREGVRPHIVGEFDDSALMKALGQAGLGLFPAPSPIAARGVSPVRRPLDRNDRVRPPEVLRHHRRSQAQAPGGDRDLRGGPAQALPVARRGGPTAPRRPCRAPAMFWEAVVQGGAAT